MNQRILLFIVIFLGFLIVVGTTVVITTVIERSGKVQFFSNSEEKEATINKNDGICKLSQVKEVIVISENKLYPKRGTGSAFLIPLFQLWRKYII